MRHANSPDDRGFPFRRRRRPGGAAPRPGGAPSTARRPSEDTPASSYGPAYETPGPQVGAVLRAEARRHTPDSAAMLARIQRATLAGDRHDGQRRNRTTAGQHRGTVAAARAALAAGAVVAVAAAGWVVTRHPMPHPAKSPPLADATASGTSPAPQPHTDGDGTVNARSATPTSPATMTASPPPGRTPAQLGYLWSDGFVDKSSSIDFSQSDIMLKNAKPLTALTLVLRLADTPQLKSTGAWSTVPTQHMSITVQPGEGVLIYTFTLRPGVTLSPGEYEFAGQYTHASGVRNAGNDSYRAAALAAGQSAVEVSGTFGRT